VQFILSEPREAELPPREANLPPRDAFRGRQNCLPGRQFGGGKTASRGGRFASLGTFNYVTYYYSVELTAMYLLPVKRATTQIFKLIPDS